MNFRFVIIRQRNIFKNKREIVFPSIVASIAKYDDQEMNERTCVRTRH